MGAERVCDGQLEVEELGAPTLNPPKCMAPVAPKEVKIAIANQLG